MSAISRVDGLPVAAQAGLHEIRPRRRRGSVVRRALLAADSLGLLVAFLIAFTVFGAGTTVDATGELVLFFVSLPLWLLVSKLHGLYERDEVRASHSTADDVVGVFHVVTIAVWLFFVGSWITGLADPDLPKLATFWLLALMLVTGARAVARAAARRSPAYLQRTVVVGAGEVGQLLARKMLMHPEYGIELLGFVDDHPRSLRPDLGDVPLLGGAGELRSIISELDVERVVISFSNDSEERTRDIVRSLRDTGVQVDVVPRLFELIGPKAGVHPLEGLPLVGVPPTSASSAARVAKRTLDIAVAGLALLVTAPLIAFIAWRVRRDTPGPAFFRQTRLGQGGREFTVLKFRTMRSDTEDGSHREYIRGIMSSGAAPASNGLYKLERRDVVTPVGRWLRKTSLDELPQLVNVLRGEMSLVGPRPCIPYETENFEPHHFERFLVPAGITGLWQVTARAHSSFGEALDLDVAYARNWSFGLDLRLIFRTPVEMLRQRVGTA